jgi:hypothetical protein
MTARITPGTTIATWNPSGRIAPATA